MSPVTITPAFKPGDRVRYVEDGVLSMYRGVVEAVAVNPQTEQVVYRVGWASGPPDPAFYPAARLARDAT